MRNIFWSYKLQFETEKYISTAFYYSSIGGIPATKIDNGRQEYAYAPLVPGGYRFPLHLLPKKMLVRTSFISVSASHGLEQREGMEGQTQLSEAYVSCIGKWTK